MRVGAAQRELARDKGARFLPPGYSYSMSIAERGFASSAAPSMSSAQTSGTTVNITFDGAANKFHPQFNPWTLCSSLSG